MMNRMIVISATNGIVYSNYNKVFSWMNLKIVKVIQDYWWMFRNLWINTSLSISNKSDKTYNDKNLILLRINALLIFCVKI